MALISPVELKKNCPSKSHTKELISHFRKTIQKILEGQDPRILFIIGPCSIHRIDEGLEFAEKLQKLAKEMEDECFIVMRAYVEKPRTRQGWRGFIHDPQLNGSHDIEMGLKQSRFFFQELANLEVPAATEFLTPQIAPYIEDLISWGCIGARTSSSPIHRQLAASLPMPIGFKNSVDGNIDTAIDGICVARSPQVFLHLDENAQLINQQTIGNLHPHLVLRGDESRGNFHKGDIQKALAKLRVEELPPRIIVDCSHGNSQGQYWKQKQVFEEVLEQIKQDDSHIMGIMLESNLEAGRQQIPTHLDDLQRGVSITDGCLDFSETAQLVRSVSSKLMISTQS